jgi:hypothetical protein
MIEAQRIACENRAAVEISFAAKGTGVTTRQTETTPVLHTAPIDLAYYPFKEGIELWPDVKVGADARTSPPPRPESIKFTLNGRTAYYVVTGVTINWQTVFRTLSEPSGRPAAAAFPPDVPLNLLPYDNWDHTIHSPGVLTCAPRTASDVVSVCNWAKENGYHVRARGVSRTAARVTASGLDGNNALNPLDHSFQPPSRDIWGPSKNTLLYIQDTTLRVTANGYAIHLKKADVQRAVSDFAFKFDSMLKAYATRMPAQYPVNSALEIRVTSLDDPVAIGEGSNLNAESPVISALSKDARDVEKGWDVALWLDVLTLPGTPHTDEFYSELECWLVDRFSGDSGRTLPEWSKGWGYTPDRGAWTNSDFFDHIRRTFSESRNEGNNWKWEVETLKDYDRSNLFTNPLLNRLFGS